MEPSEWKMDKIDYSKHYDSLFCPTCITKVSPDKITEIEHDQSTEEYGNFSVKVDGCSVCYSQVYSFLSRTKFTVLTILASSPILILVIYVLKTSTQKDLPLAIFCCFFFLVIDCCIIALFFRKRFKVINLIKKIEA